MKTSRNFTAVIATAAVLCAASSVAKAQTARAIDVQVEDIVRKTVKSAANPQTRRVRVVQTVKPDVYQQPVNPGANIDVNVRNIQSLAFDPSGNTLFATTSQRPTIGVSVSPADGVLRSQLPATQGRYGLVVTQVVKKSPAESAGLKVNDVLLSANGKPLAVLGDLTKIVSAKKVKVPIAILLLRSGRKISATVRPTKPKANADIVIWHMRTGQRLSKYMIGIETSSVPASLNAQLKLPKGTGVVVDQVYSNSPAAKAGLKKYDVLVKAGDTPLKQHGDLGQQLDAAKGKPVTLSFVRGGHKLTCTVTPKQRKSDFQPMHFDPRVNKGLHWLNTHGRSWSSGGGGEMMGAMNPFATTTMRQQKDLKTQIDRLTEQIAGLKKAIDDLRKAVVTENKRRRR